MYELEINEIKTQIEAKLSKADKNSIDEIMTFFMSPLGRICIKNDKEVEMVYKFLQAIMIEAEDKRQDLLINVKTISQMKKKDDTIKNVLYRIYAKDYSSDTVQDILKLLNENISIYTFVVYSGYFNIGGSEIISGLTDILFDNKEVVKAILILNVSLKMYNNDLLIANKLANYYETLGMHEEAQRVLVNAAENRQNGN